MIGRGYRELAQHFPQPGWVEHDPEEIWPSVQRCRGGAGRRRRAAGDLAAIGITNQRETTLLWERATRPAGRAGDRVAGPPHRRALPRARRRS